MHRTKQVSPTRTNQALSNLNLVSVAIHIVWNQMTLLRAIQAAVESN